MSIYGIQSLPLEMKQSLCTLVSSGISESIINFSSIRTYVYRIRSTYYYYVRTQGVQRLPYKESSSTRKQGYIKKVPHETHSVRITEVFYTYG